MAKNELALRLPGCLPLCVFLLFLTFLVLKLTAVVAWSWWWVTAPLWGYALVLVAFFGALLLALGVVALIAVLSDK